MGKNAIFSSQNEKYRHTFDKIKCEFPTIFAGIFLIGAVFSAIVALLGYRYEPTNEIIHFAIMSAALILITILCVYFKGHQSRIATSCSFWLPILATGYSLALCLITKDTRAYSFICYNLLCFVCAIVIFFGCYRKKERYGAMLLVVVLLSMGQLFNGFMSATFGQFGIVTKIQSLASPTLLYTAVVYSSDEGALGGSTYVTVRHEPEISILIGTHIGTFIKEADIYKGRYGEGFDMVLEWTGENTLSINGDEYRVDGQ